jgi:membrane fusion protein, adhesin transport system
MASSRKSDLEFASEYDAALRRGAPKGVVTAVILIGLMITAFLVWASWAKLDEVTRGEGRVIPSSKTQMVQSLEGGIVKELLVRTGDRIKKGDVLVRIDDTGFSSNLGEVTAKMMTFTARTTRLRHEAAGDLGTDPQFPTELVASSPDLVKNELSLFQAKRNSLQTQLGILKERVEQRIRELGEVKTALVRFQTNLKLANEEMKLKKPLAVQGIVPRTELIKLERDIADTAGQISTQNETEPKLEAAVREAQGQVKEQEEKFRQDARAELSEAEAQLAVTQETLRAAKDRVFRADIKSPVEGIVNKINSNTVGGVVQAGQTLMEIVPLEDSLFIEAKIRPADIAFVRPKQAAVVKITAYDFSVYGGLEGEVERISADSVYDEQTRENFYLVTVKTLQNQLKSEKESLPIIPGMVASVDILTGKKSVLDYLLKPINKARAEALRER